MNEDYLWDKSGEPDPEIERLEKVLAPLRYERRVEPLPLPDISRWTFARGFSPMLAAAAVFLIMILAGGLWLALRPSRSTDGASQVTTDRAPEGSASEPTVSGTQPAPGGSEKERLADDRNTTGPGALVADAAGSKPPRRVSDPRVKAKRHRRVNDSARQVELTREGENAKAQLILALHIASDKLSSVQKRIQTSPGS